MKFKTGDKVAVYSDRDRKIGIVSTGQEISQPRIRVDYDLINYEWVFPQQCRKIVKKSGRRIWVLGSDVDRALNPIHGMYPDAIIRDKPGVTISGKDWIEFVEVKKNKKLGE